MMSRLLIVVLALSFTALPASAHAGQQPLAKVSDVLVVGGIAGSGLPTVVICVWPPGVFIRATTPGASFEVYRDTNGNGVVDRFAHEDDAQTPQNESHTADERIAGRSVPGFGVTLPFCAR
jgi:hypothetical protein